MAVKEKDKKKAEKDDAEEKEGPETKAQAKDDADEATESKHKDAKSGPSLGAKIFRAFLFTFLAAFVTAFLFADPIPNGLRVNFDLLASIKLALIAGVISAVLRAVASALPLFSDD